MNKDVAVQTTLFKREYTNIVKALCIFLMFALHLIKREWLIYPDNIVGLKIHGEYLSFLIARTGDICIGVFAFITGYGWAGKHYQISPKRILSTYISYWVTLVLFNWPARMLLTYLDKGVLFSEGIVFTPAKIVISILGIASQASTFCWYIFFFCLVALTYPLLEKMVRITDKIVNKSVVGGLCHVVVICALSMIARVANNKLYSMGCYDSVIHSVMYHYFTWVPCVLLGISSKTYSWMDKIDKAVHGKAVLGILLPVLVIATKMIMAEVLHLTSNVDSIFIIPFCYGLIKIAQIIYEYHNLNKVLSIIGRLSLYMWLAHATLLLDIPEKLLCSLRLPVLIVTFSVAIMIPVSLLLRKADDLIKRVVKIGE